MTIPMVIMVASAAVWLVATLAVEPIKIWVWLGDAARILFAVSTFWVVAGTVNRSVF